MFIGLLSTFSGQLLVPKCSRVFLEVVCAHGCKAHHYEMILFVRLSWQQCKGLLRTFACHSLHFLHACIWNVGMLIIVMHYCIVMGTLLSSCYKYMSFECLFLVHCTHLVFFFFNCILSLFTCGP